MLGGPHLRPRDTLHDAAAAAGLAGALSEKAAAPWRFMAPLSGANLVVPRRLFADICRTKA